ncbi:MAG: hypothetical protein IJ479_07350 [Alphaproteobacteria bacterium]|nr:hypothetical protein [Alphaproteobacteria bacterium]
MTFNGQKMPSISPDAYLVGCRRKSCKSFKQRVKEFLKSEDFQNFCNLKKNGVQDGSVLWLVHSEWPLLTLEGTKGEIEADFDIISSDVPYLYKSHKFISRADDGEKQIYFSQSYIVRKNPQGEWIADLILKDEDWLKHAAVKAAFEEVARVKGYRLIGNIGVYGIKFRSVDTQAWVTIAMSSEGVGKVMACLLDNGRLVDLDTAEAELQRTPLPSVVKTKFNWFKYWDNNVLIRN